MSANDEIRAALIAGEVLTMAGVEERWQVDGGNLTHALNRLQAEGYTIDKQLIEPQRPGKPLQYRVVGEHPTPEQAAAALDAWKKARPKKPKRARARRGVAPAASVVASPAPAPPPARARATHPAPFAADNVNLPQLTPPHDHPHLGAECRVNMVKLEDDGSVLVGMRVLGDHDQQWVAKVVGVYVSG